MLYNEFVEGTGCKDNEHNYQVYKNLEVMYMNSDMSKAEIYEYGKKLVDNSKSEAELKLEAEVKEEIEGLKADIEWYKQEIGYRKAMVELWMESEDKDMIKAERNMIKYYRDAMKSAKARIRMLRDWFLK